MKNSTLTAILVAAILAALAIPGRGQTFDRVQEVANVIYELVKVAPRRGLAKKHQNRLALARDIVTSSNDHGVPEFLLTVKLYNESSFRSDVWDATQLTYGMGQMHGVATVGCNTRTRKGQIDCAAKWMRVCYDRCKTWPKALAAYGTSGHCDWSKAKRPKHYRSSIVRQIKQWQEFEQQRQSTRDTIIDDLEHIAAMRGDTEADNGE